MNPGSVMSRKPLRFSTPVQCANQPSKVIAISGTNHTTTLQTIYVAPNVIAAVKANCFEDIIEYRNLINFALYLCFDNLYTANTSLIAVWDLPDFICSTTCVPK